MNLTRTMNFDDNKLVPAKQSSDPEIIIRRHKPDIENLSEQVFLRTQQILVSEQNPYLYANPIVTITCDKPTPHFFSIVRKHQAEWCKQSLATLGRRATRKTSNWCLENGQHSISSKHRKFLKFMTRGLCFTGLLFVSGKPIPKHEWRNVSPKS